MSKIGNACNMIKLLAENGKMSCKELADKLEVSERMIRKYIQDLEQAGIYIDSMRGRGGGYVFNKNKCKFINYFTKNNR
ncbi:MAG: Helix-turn-helix, type 11 domain protein [Clostridiaceae bacterium]|jgi:predicted DNA-binding transcriptional regulator YafY|nr:Helix-turn-helix, type 11 domain protein [Clostridiaceae bacterium]